MCVDIYVGVLDEYAKKERKKVMKKKWEKGMGGWVRRYVVRMCLSSR